MIPFIGYGLLALIAGAFVIGVFWNDIKDFIQESWEDIKTIIVPSLIEGWKTYVQTGSVAQALYSAKQVAIQKFYSRTNNGKWKETTMTKEISFEDLPEDIQKKLKRAKGKEVDITEEVKETLELEG